ncbi:hypothetical protein DERF_011762 [Dermatophagoides farinae]|uniref:Uncharacterized protein n=1 Tax=Dermatophagoides farinae TaxID=6954 RepID=A0A922HVM7_DERFA|nr:hypothetical protein DERF_011762 [Dermatophagoides farinae]
MSENKSAIKFDIDTNLERNFGQRQSCVIGSQTIPSISWECHDNGHHGSKQRKHQCKEYEGQILGASDQIGLILGSIF